MSLPTHSLELLSPARDTVIAKEAILQGADAVYIAVAGFGAQRNASNSVADIAERVQFAHLFHARVFVTLNTILHEDKLAPARSIRRPLSGFLWVMSRKSASATWSALSAISAS